MWRGGRGAWGLTVPLGDSGQEAQWVLKGMGMRDGNKVEADTRLGRLLKRKQLNLHLLPGSFWVVLELTEKESYQASDYRSSVWSLNSGSLICQEAEIEGAVPGTKQTLNVNCLPRYYPQFWNKSYLLTSSLWPLEQLLLERKAFGLWKCTVIVPWNRRPKCSQPYLT